MSEAPAVKLGEGADAVVDGDLFDNDSGEHLGSIDLINYPLPAAIMLFYQGNFYVYKIDSRIPEDEVTRQA